MSSLHVLAALLAGCLILLCLLAVRHLRVIRDVEKRLNALDEGRPVPPLAGAIGGIDRGVAAWFRDRAPALQDRLQQLEADRQQLQAVLSGMSEGVLAVDSRQRLLFANPAARGLFQLGDDAVGRLVAELIRNPQIQRSLDDALAGGPPKRSEVTKAGADFLTARQDRVLSLQATPLAGDPPAGAVLVFHDVTDLRRLERMRQDFVANASHELKTPLASIKVNAETLLDWGLKDDSVNVMLLQQIDQQVDRLAALVQDMLSLARLESGQETFRHEPLEIGPALLECASRHAVRAGSQGLEFEVDLARIPDDVLVRIADEAVVQILDNLIDNALKYTPAGGKVRVSGRLADDQVLVEVVDSGSGIPREDLPRVFERFYRVDKARSRSIGGTGLGLSIVKNLVQSVGGQVSVESHLGRGSTFLVRLPVHRACGVGVLPGAGGGE